MTKPFAPTSDPRGVPPISRIETRRFPRNQADIADIADKPPVVAQSRADTVVVTVSVNELARRHGVPPYELAAWLAELAERGLVERGEAWRLSERGDLQFGRALRALEDEDAE
jgi:transposase-like protein